MTQTDQDILSGFRAKPPNPAPRSLRVGWIAFAGGVLLGAAVLMDFLTFGITARLAGDDASGSAYLDHRLKVSQIASMLQPAALPERDYGAAPLSMDEKSKLGRRMSVALPPAPEGWTRRAYHEDDFWVLRPDLMFCQKFSDKTLRSMARLGNSGDCPPGLGGDGIEVYAKGDQRIAVLARYIPGAVGTPVQALVNAAPLPGFGLTHFAASGEARTLSPFFQSGDWRFARLPMSHQRRDGQTMARPERIYARNVQQGMVDVFVVSNARDGTAKRIVQGLDHGFLSAMIAPDV